MRTPGLGTGRTWLPAVSLLAGAITLASTSFAQAASSWADAGTAVPMGWSVPVTVDTSPPFGTANPLSAIACPRASWCLAGDRAGNLLFSTDPGGGSAAWHKTASGFANSGQDLTGIAELICPTTSFCLAAVSINDGPPYAIFTSTNPTGNHSAWHRVRRGLLGDISCPSASLCASGWGHHLIYSADPAAGTSSVWKTITLSQTTNLTGVSCASRSFCLATDDAGTEFASTNPTGGVSTWKSGLVNHLDSILSPSCPSASFCTALDSGGDFLYSTDPAGGAMTWQATNAPLKIFSIVCVSRSFCYGRDTLGDVLTTSNPVGGRKAWQVTDVAGSEPISAVSCPAVEACAAVTEIGAQAGSVFTTTDPGGGPSAWQSAEIDGVNTITSLNCPALAFCVAGDDAGNLLIATNPGGGTGAWSRLRLATPVGVFTAISCAGTSLCVAGDNQGDIAWSADPGGGASAWRVADVDGSAAITSVTCPTADLCVAGDASGNIVSSAAPASGGSSWHVTSIGSSPGPLYVSCPSATFCVSTGTTTVFNSTNPTGGGGAWTLTASIPAAAGIGPVACPTTTLCVALGGFVRSVNDGPQPVLYSTHQPAGDAADWHIVDQGGENFFGRPVGALSCPSAALCLADDTGVVFDSTNPAGTSDTTWQPAGVSASAVSCPTATRCVAVTGASNIQVGTVLTPTSTAITSAPKSALTGQKITVKFRVRSAGTPATMPTGPVTVSYSGNVKCTAKLSAKKGISSGECSFTVSHPGNHVLTAAYAIHGQFAASSASRRLVIRKN